MGRVSLTFLPYTHSAGERPPNRGVFLKAMIPWVSLSSQGWCAPSFVDPLMTFFMAFTAASALPLVLGRWGALGSTRTFHLERKSVVSVAVNWGPLSGLTDSGTVWARNCWRSLVVMAVAVVSVPRPWRSGQPEYSSVTTRYWRPPNWQRSRCRIWKGLVALGPWSRGWCGRDGRVSRHGLHLDTICVMSALMVGHQTVLLALSWVFLMP